MTEVLTHTALGPLLLILAILFKIFPAKNINKVYGYRARRSMMNKEAWQYSNLLFNNLFIIVAILLTLAQLVFAYLFSYVESVMYTIFTLLGGTAFLFFYVERPLKEKFGNKQDDQE